MGSVKEGLGEATSPILKGETEDCREIKWLVALRSYKSESEKWTETMSPPCSCSGNTGSLLSVPLNTSLIKVTSGTKMMRLKDDETKMMVPSG